MTAAISNDVGTRMINNSPSAGVDMLANPLSGAGARAKPPSLTSFSAMEIPVKGPVTRAIAGPHKKKSLEHGVIDCVVETGQQSERRQVRQTVRLKDHACADSH